jgi:MYXO-CTERM domain-containing protein
MEIYKRFTQALLLPVLLGAPLAHAASYQVQGIGSLGSVVTGINNSGQISGYSYAFTDGDGIAVNAAFLYSGSTMTVLAPYTQAYAINNAGQMTGENQKSSVGYYEAFRYSGGATTNLGMHGYYYSTGVAINDSGVVAGNGDFGRGEAYGFTYDASMHDLPTFGGNWSIAKGINNQGEVVGQATYFTNQVEHAVWYSSSGMVDLTPDTDHSTIAVGINDAGQILINDNGRSLLYQNGVSVDMGTLSAGYGVQATAINQLGQAVGNADTSGGAHGFIYSNGTMIDLNSLIDPASGWTITSASDINDLGQITAQACNALGCQGVRLDLTSAVPEPASSSLALAGLGMLFGWSRRKAGA